MRRPASPEEKVELNGVKEDEARCCYVTFLGTRRSEQRKDFMGKEDEAERIGGAECNSHWQ